MPDKVLTDEKLPNGWEKRMAEDTGKFSKYLLI